MVETVLEQWGEQGWKQHIAKVQDFYTKVRACAGWQVALLRCTRTDCCLRQQRRDVFLSYAQKHLRTCPVDWNMPSAGMFVWFHLRNIKDTEKLIKERALEQKVRCYCMLLRVRFRYRMH
jgi:hypothetical protein